MAAHKVGQLWKFKRNEADEWVRHDSASQEVGSRE